MSYFYILSEPSVPRPRGARLMNLGRQRRLVLTISLPAHSASPSEYQPITNIGSKLECLIPERFLSSRFGLVTLV